LPSGKFSALAISGACHMKEPKDDSPLLGRIVSLIVALIFTVLGVLAIRKGHVTVGRTMKLDFTASQDPVAYWTYIGLYFIVAAFFFYIGLKPRR
jgi:UPF0716 family protein affecting phage T7 exclusion